MNESNDELLAELAALVVVLARECSRPDIATRAGEIARNVASDQHQDHQFKERR